MLGQILVPLDGSEFAESAIPTATQLAARTGAELLLVKVHEPSMALVPVAGLPVAGVPDDLEVRAAEQAYLGRIAADLGTVGAGPVAIEMVDGLPGPALADFVNRKRPDLVVMSTHGRGPLSRFWLGSIADHMVRHSAVPILLLRPVGNGAAPAAAAPLGRVLVPLDRSDQALRALRPLEALSPSLNPAVVLFNVVEPILGVESMPPYPLAVPGDVLESLRGEARGHLEEAAAGLRAKGLEVETRVTVGVGVAAMILTELEQEGIDFVAMTTHGAGGLKRLLLGSVADKVIRGATKPVLVVGPGSSDGKH